MTETLSLPAIAIDEAVYDRVYGIADALAARQPDLAAYLHRELARATLVPPGALPAATATIGARLRFRPDRGAAERSATLVYPGDVARTEAAIAVTTPVGAALLGLSPGQSIAWHDQAGRTRLLTLLAVESAGTRQ